MEFSMVVLVKGSGLGGIDVLKERMTGVEVPIGNAWFCGW